MGEVLRDLCVHAISFHEWVDCRCEARLGSNDIPNVCHRLQGLLPVLFACWEFLQLFFHLGLCQAQATHVEALAGTLQARDGPSANPILVGWLTSPLSHCPAFVFCAVIFRQAGNNVNQLSFKCSERIPPRTPCDPSRLPQLCRCETCEMWAFLAELSWSRVTRFDKFVTMDPERIADVRSSAFRPTCQT